MELNSLQRQKVVDYLPSLSALDPIRTAPLVLLCGIVGAGKDVTREQLMTAYPGEYQFIVTHVTRPPRINNGVLEEDGKDYYFIDFKTAEHMLDTGAYIEADIVHADHIYGTSIAEVKQIYKSGKIALTDVTPHGAGSYVKLGLNVRPVFLFPPSYVAWRVRLEKRGVMPQEELKRRLQSAVKEISYALEVAFFYFVINDDLEKTAELVDHISHGEPIERHPSEAVKVAEELLRSIKVELSTLDS